MIPTRSRIRLVLSFSFLVLVLSASLDAETSRWIAEKAKAWYDQQPWLVGSNCIPADAINELEMWQAETFNPGQIDKELGWAEDMGMNTIRVFLQDLVRQQNPEGFKKRIDQFLEISSRHHIKPLFVLFDSSRDPQPKLGCSIRRFLGCTIRDGCSLRDARRLPILLKNQTESLRGGSNRSVRK